MAFTLVSFVSYGQYCTSGGPSSPNDSDLGAFSATGANSTSLTFAQNCTNNPTGVEDLTASTNIEFASGGTYTGSVTWGTCGGNFGNAGTIWIDFDADGTFSAGEVVHTWSGTPTVTEAVTIVVPAAASVASGITRMRVQQQESGALPLDPCATFTWGSVVDFGVTLTGGALCANPGSVSASTAGTSATINFTSSTGSSYLEYGLAGFVQGTGTTVNNVTSPHTINNLTNNTDYDVYVHDNCSATSNSSSGALVSFLTPCAPFTAPYSMGFEGNTTCWIQEDNDDDDWTLGSNAGFISNNTHPSAASEGTDYLYLEANNVANGERISIVSPEIDFGTGASPAVTFDYHMWGGVIGTLDLEVDSALTGNWVNVWSLSGDQGNQWSLAEVSLVGYGSTVKVRFVGTSIGCCAGDMAFDNVNFYPDYCFNPFDVSVYSLPTTGVATFNSYNNAVTVEYGPSGFFPGTGTTQAGITSPFTMGGLAPNTQYDAIFFDSCGTNLSLGTTYTFTTPCAAVIAPITESFEGALSTCWPQYINDNFDWTQNTGGTTSTNGPSGASDGTEYMYTEVSPTSSGDVAVLESQFIDFTAISSPAIRFDYHMFGGDMGTLTLEVDSALTGNWVNIWSLSGDQGDQWNTALASLAAYTDAIFNQTRVRFVGTSLGCCSGDMAIDNVRFDEYCLTVAAAPFIEGFEFGCYSQSTMDVFDWTISSNGTPSPGTGASGSSEGNLYAFTESSASAGVGAGDSAIMMTQMVDITTLTYPELAFEYHMWDNTNVQMGELRAEISNDMGMTWMPVWSISGNQGDEWHTAKVNLEVAGAGDTVGIRFVGILGGNYDPVAGTGVSWHSDISLDNITIDDGLSAELELIDVIADFTTCASTGNPVAIVVKNNGFTPLYDFSFGAVINGTQITQIYTDTIEPTMTATLMLSNGVDLQPGMNTIGYGFAGADFGDLDPSNDFDTFMHAASGSADGDNYSTDWEAGMDGWSGTGDWELGTPANTIISAAAGGTEAWVTGLTGNYSDNVESFLYSPCFDFSSYASDPVISFDAYWDIEDAFDGAWVEVSTDAGLSWTKVGAMGSGTNWYNVNVTQQPIGDVWNGTDTATVANGSQGWVNASNRVMGTAGMSSVQFRFVMWGDGGTNNEGFGIDNFAVTPWCPADLGLTTTVFSASNGDTDDGGAAVTASNGTAPYTYAWSNGSTSSVADSLSGGFTTYTVTVTDANGCTDMATVNVVTVSADFISTMTSLDIFPNPAQTTANILINFEQAADVQVELVNIVGQVVTSTRQENVTNGEFTFNVEDYPAGVYLVRINANDESVTRRLVITK